MPRAIADSDPPSPPDVPDTEPAPPPQEAPPPAPAPAPAPPSDIVYRPMAPLPPKLEPSTESVDRTSAYVASSIAGAALLGTLICFLEFNAASDRAGQSEPGRLGTDAQAKLTAAYAEADTWRTRTLAVGGVALVSSVVAAYFWGETPPMKPRLNVQPTTGGAAVSLGGRF
jgi:hypothetical protein